MFKFTHSIAYTHQPFHPHCTKDKIIRRHLALTSVLCQIQKFRIEKDEKRTKNLVKDAFHQICVYSSKHEWTKKKMKCSVLLWENYQWQNIQSWTNLCHSHSISGFLLTPQFLRIRSISGVSLFFFIWIFHKYSNFLIVALVCIAVRHSGMLRFWKFKCCWRFSSFFIMFGTWESNWARVKVYPNPIARNMPWKPRIFG